MVLVYFVGGAGWRFVATGPAFGLEAFFFVAHFDLIDLRPLCNLCLVSRTLSAGRTQSRRAEPYGYRAGLGAFLSRYLVSTYIDLPRYT